MKGGDLKKCNRIRKVEEAVVYTIYDSITINKYSNRCGVFVCEEFVQFA